MPVISRQEPHTAAAHHAAIDKQFNRVAPISRVALVNGRMSCAAFGLAVLEVIILQVAFACLARNGAVDGVIDQQGFFHLRLVLFVDRVAIGDKHGAVFGRRLAGRDELGNHSNGAGLGIARAGFN